MKRTVCLLLAILVAFTFAVSSFAATSDEYGNFIKSPEMEYEGNVVSAWFQPGQAIEILLTPFLNRDILAKDVRTKIETAYTDILHCKYISDLAGGFDGVYNGLVSNLAVSTLFDLSWTQGDLSRDATITIGGLDLSHFVCLLHYGEDGWEIVKNATILGVNLVFSIGNLSPFAVVVDASAYGEAVTSPATGDIFTAVAVCAAIALGCGAVYFISRSRKKAEDII
ncbi:MAG: hypothetical protein IJM02_02825 [Clostridia bacterium]|jgi:hypothetical protein|nr:hypothetical protein [Clostridia bacterium]